MPLGGRGAERLALEHGAVGQHEQGLTDASRGLPADLRRGKKKAPAGGRRASKRVGTSAFSCPCGPHWTHFTVRRATYHRAVPLRLRSDRAPDCRSPAPEARDGPGRRRRSPMSLPAPAPDRTAVVTGASSGHRRRASPGSWPGGATASPSWPAAPTSSPSWPPSCAAPGVRAEVLAADLTDRDGPGRPARPGRRARPGPRHPGQQRRALHAGPGGRGRPRRRDEHDRGRRGGRGRPVHAASCPAWSSGAGAAS